MDFSNNTSESGRDAESLSRITHDLRNPLNSISMNAELVKLKLQQAGDPEHVVGYLDRILQECRNCSAVLESPLETSAQDPEE